MRPAKTIRPRVPKFFTSWTVFMVALLLVYATVKTFAIDQHFSAADVLLNGQQCLAAEVAPNPQGSCLVRAAIRQTWSGNWHLTLVRDGTAVSLDVPNTVSIVFFSEADYPVPPFLIMLPLFALTATTLYCLVIELTGPRNRSGLHTE